MKLLLIVTTVYSVYATTSAPDHLPMAADLAVETDSYNPYLKQWLIHLNPAIRNAKLAGQYNVTVSFPDWCFTPTEYGGELVDGCFVFSQIRRYLEHERQYKLNRRCCFSMKAEPGDVNNYSRVRWISNPGNPDGFVMCNDIDLYQSQERDILKYFQIQMNARQSADDQIDPRQKLEDDQARRKVYIVPERAPRVKNLKTVDYNCTMFIDWDPLKTMMGLTNLVY